MHPAFSVAIAGDLVGFRVGVGGVVDGELGAAFVKFFVDVAKFFDKNVHGFLSMFEVSVGSGCGGPVVVRWWYNGGLTVVWKSGWKSGR